MTEETGRKRARKHIAAAAAAAPAITPNDTANPFLPQDCPVRPIGHNGLVCYYLDASRQFIALPAEKHSKSNLQKMFGSRVEYLYRVWPRIKEDGTRDGFRAELAARALMESCSHLGLWDPSNCERGRGAWRGDAGELVLHLGPEIVTFAPTPCAWADKIVREPGLIGRYVYPAGKVTGVPADTVVPGCAETLLGLLKTWTWRRPETDPVLLLGWIGAALVAGALDWRPMVWLTGGRGTGKSTLQDLLESTLGDGVIKLAETSEAYIRQTLRHQTLPVILDEAESEEDNRKLNAIVKLAQLASSGGTLGRGSSDHVAVEFTMRSAFLFGSILLPGMLGPARSRLAILELGELAHGTAQPDVSRGKWSPIGAQLRRRMVDNWHRWDATLTWYRQALAEKGYARREQDQFGTLLAAADMLLYEGAANAQTGDEWIEALTLAGLTEAQNESRDERECLDHLLSIAVDPFRNGTRKLMAEWLRIAAGWDGGDADQARKVLVGYGLKLRRKAGEDWRLAVANNHRELATLYEGTRWAARSGSVGVWVQALRRLPGAQHAGAVYYGGVTFKSTDLPLATVLTRVDPDAQAPLL